MSALKESVREHWQAEACGTRYSDSEERKAYFRQIAEARYRLEPFIPGFARFEEAQGKDILEIGVGAGSDFENWCRHARHATGVDLTERAIGLVEERLSLSGVPKQRFRLQTADAENLPFADARFDLVYSWGVLHHTPDTPKAFAEAYRVLRPGGTLRAMVYHEPSWVGLMLAVRNGWLRGRPMSQKTAMFRHLESPGTKSYRVAEARRMVADVGFTDVVCRTVLSPGDLLLHERSDRVRSRVDDWVYGWYPRWLVRALGNRFGLYLTVEASKPE